MKCYRLSAFVPRLIPRFGSEGKAKVERKMNEELSKKLRPSSYYSTTKLRKNYENCEQKHYYFIHFLVFALSCLKLRRNDIVLSQKGVETVEMTLSTPFSQFKVSFMICLN